jgi:hypothetical protein
VPPRHLKDSPTLRAHVFHSLYIVHVFERLSLLLGKLLLIIVLAGPRYAVKKDAALLGVPEVVDDGGDDQTDTGGAQHREYADHDALCRRPQTARRRYPYGIVM